MEISTFEAWQEEELLDQQRSAVIHPEPENVQFHIDQQRRLERQREELLAQFPYSVVAEGEYSEHDYARRWCWQNIGPRHGKCDDFHTEYPGCPLVLATESVEQGTWKDKSGKELSREWKAYTNPGEHSHEGAWTSLWLGKTGYDYGYTEFCFVNESDLANFLVAFPTFTWSESWG